MTWRRHALWLVVLYVGFLVGGELLAHDHAAHAAGHSDTCFVCVWHAAHPAPSLAATPGRPHHSLCETCRPEKPQQPHYTFSSPATASQAPPAPSGR